MKINWKKQMMEFLKGHGWEVVDEGLIEHPLFPLIEDVSTEKLLTEFVEKFYENPWKSYKSLIDCYANVLLDESGGKNGQ